LAKNETGTTRFSTTFRYCRWTARVMDPFDGINTGKHWCGKFLKDYNPIPW
jgi:hypothetical protein